MASFMPPERGTLIISALLLLALFFAGVWINQYVDTGGAPWNVLPWFGAGALLIIVIGILSLLRRP